jgi:tetratricopeptide (TPR) repeat protein
MKNLYYLFAITVLLGSSCQTKSPTVTKMNGSEKTFYEAAKYYLSEAAHNKGLEAIHRAIQEKNQKHLVELYYLKGFILHAYGETIDARAAYRYVIDHTEAYSLYKNKAAQLLALNLAEEEFQEEIRVKQEELLKNKNNEQLTDHSYLMVEKQPRFPDCPETTQTEIQKCSSQIVQEHIVRTYDVGLGNTFGVYEKVRTQVYYTIDTEGNVAGIAARGPNAFLSLEAKRVLFSLPQMIPGESRGEKVSVPFSVPVTYNPMQ